MLSDPLFTAVVSFFLLLYTICGENRLRTSPLRSFNEIMMGHWLMKPVSQRLEFIKIKHENYQIQDPGLKIRENNVYPDRKVLECMVFLQAAQTESFHSL